RPPFATPTGPSNLTATPPLRRPPLGPTDGLSPADAPPGPLGGGEPPGLPGVVTVDVSPFTSFTAVNRLHAAVSAAPGVSRAAIVAFRAGKLRLRVHHPDARALATTLQALDVGPLRVLRLSPDSLELLLGSPPPASAGPTSPPTPLT